MEPIYEVDHSGKIIWEMIGISDSTWGSDPDDGRSISGFIFYSMGVPISWRSKTQKGVTLSSPEIKYVAISELVKEIKYTLQVLETL